MRLFISSTFKDMHSEREHLIRVVMPVLRQWCDERKLHLIECDLRWGVPKDADTRETLLTCLSEIDRYNCAMLCLRVAVTMMLCLSDIQTNCRSRLCSV